VKNACWYTKELWNKLFTVNYMTIFTINLKLNYMKNIGMALLIALMIASCGKKEEQPTEVNTTTESTTVEKTVVVDTVPAPEKKGTSVKINSDGVDVDSKDVDVEIKK
jgi:hypothetical protein